MATNYSACLECLLLFQFLGPLHDTGPVGGPALIKNKVFPSSAVLQEKSGKLGHQAAVTCVQESGSVGGPVIIGQLVHVLSPDGRRARKQVKPAHGDLACAV